MKDRIPQKEFLNLQFLWQRVSFFFPSITLQQPRFVFEAVAEWDAVMWLAAGQNFGDQQSIDKSKTKQGTPKGRYRKSSINSRSWKKMKPKKVVRMEEKINTPTEISTGSIASLTLFVHHVLFLDLGQHLQQIECRKMCQQWQVLPIIPWNWQFFWWLAIFSCKTK